MVRKCLLIEGQLRKFVGKNGKITFYFTVLLRMMYFMTIIKEQ